MMSPVHENRALLPNFKTIRYLGLMNSGQQIDNVCCMNNKNLPYLTRLRDNMTQFGQLVENASPVWLPTVGPQEIDKEWHRADS